MLVPCVIVILLVVSVLGWILGEAKDKRFVRIPSTIGAVIVCSCIAAIASGLLTALSVGIPMATALHEYLDASAAQLKIGNTAFVLEEFEGFKKRAVVTYETGWFLKQIRSETARMESGPQAE
jgi:hypothetical protein